MVILFKLVGSILVIFASSFLGYVYSRDYSRRPAELRELQLMLQMLENEIVYLADILPEAFEKICRSSTSEAACFFKSASLSLKKLKNVDASTAWYNAVKENICKTSLNREDQEILLSFGKMLGNTDIDGQINNIRLTVQQLKQQEYKAEETRKKNETMYKNLGLLGGLAIVVVLF